LAVERRPRQSSRAKKDLKQVKKRSATFIDLMRDCRICKSWIPPALTRV
jgi:hypothetical protein